MDIERMNEDVLLHILTLLDSDEDVARAATVCHTWHELVVEGRLWKQLCMRRFPELKLFQKFSVSESSTSQVTEREREHSFFCDLYTSLTKREENETCLADALQASSTDNPSEHIRQTLYPNPKRDYDLPSYWSSKGGAEDLPETLTYRLVTPLCVVNEVKIRPFEAYFQPGQPIYSAKYVRFKFGCQSKVNPKEYVWNYVSPMYPMEQSDTLQTFSLPRPVVCIGGIFQAELIGRVQKQEMDNLFYICVCHVLVHGRPLWLHDFDIKEDQSFVLKQLKEAHADPFGAVPMEEDGDGEGGEDFDEEVLRRLLGLRGWYEVNENGDVQYVQVQFE